MLKKSITFEDLEGNKLTEDFYFNFSKAELVELEMSEKGGLVGFLEEIVKTQDGQLIIDIFKKIILLAYGVRSEDGRRFIKSDELRNEFSQTDAYSELFMELATNAGAAATFMNGVIPAALAEEVKKEAEKVLVPTAPIHRDLDHMSKDELLELLAKQKAE